MAGSGSAASAASSSSGWRPTSASPGRRRTRCVSATRWWSSRTPAAASASHSAMAAPRWMRRASGWRSSACGIVAQRRTRRMTTWLVTGGAGFIGSHLCEALLARGDAVRVLDDLSTGRRENLPPASQLIEGDVADPAAVRDALRGVAGCFHLAAIASVERGVTDWLGHASCQPHRHDHRVRCGARRHGFRWSMRPPPRCTAMLATVPITEADRMPTALRLRRRQARL